MSGFFYVNIQNVWSMPKFKGGNAVHRKYCLNNNMRYTLGTYSGWDNKFYILKKSVDASNISILWAAARRFVVNIVFWQKKCLYFSRFEYVYFTLIDICSFDMIHDDRGLCNMKRDLRKCKKCITEVGSQFQKCLINEWQPYQKKEIVSINTTVPSE